MSKQAQKKITIEEWPIARLRPLERQSANFHDVSTPELRRLMAVMQKGRYDAIEITPDGRIIDGHQRYRAAIELRVKTVRVRIRHDLAGDEVAIEMRHLAANEIRRQETLLDRARNARRMMELREGHDLSDWDMTSLVGEVAELLGISRKHALRLLRIADLPMEIQAAVSASKLPMVLAERVAELEEKDQERIVEMIRAGDDPRVVVKKYLPTRGRVARDLGKELDRIVEAAERGREVLDGRLGEIQRTAEQCGRDLMALRWLRDFSKQMIPKIKARKAEVEQRARDLEELQELSALSRRRRRA